MRPKSLVLLILALGCGLVASIGISQILDSKGTAQASTVASEAILVAKVDIDRSSQLSEENVVIEEWPTDKIPEGALHEMSEVEGLRPLHNITGGLPILQKMLGGQARAAGQIPEGYRVVSVRVNQESGAGLIKPGDRVDLQVFAHANPRLGVPKTGIWTFLQDVSVFAVDSQLQTEDEESVINATTISLLVTPAQAAKVTLASEVGTVRLVMRGLTDDRAADVTEADASQLFGASEKFVGNKSNDDVDIDKKFESAKSDMYAWLEEQKSLMEASLAAQQPGQPKETEQAWRMVVMAGTDVRVEEFAPGALIPTTVEQSAFGAAADIKPATQQKDTEDEYEWSEDEDDERGPKIDARDDGDRASKGKRDRDWTKDLFGE